MPGPYAVKTSAEFGFSGIELDFRSYETVIHFRCLLFSGRIWKWRMLTELISLSMTIDSLNWYGLTRPLSSRNGMLAFDGIRRGTGCRGGHAHSGGTASQLQRWRD